MKHFKVSQSRNSPKHNIKIRAFPVSFLGGIQSSKQLMGIPEGVT